MTAPAPPGGPSPLRIGGLALLGAGVVAGVIGVVGVANGGGGEPTAAPSPSASTSGLPTTDAAAIPTTEAPAPTSASGVPVPSFGPTPTNGIAAPTTAPPTTSVAAPAGAGTGSGAGSGEAPAPAVEKLPVRVYNNSTIQGLGERAAEDFRAAGWEVSDVSGYSSGVIPASTVYYTPGTGEEAAAGALGKEFGLRVEQRFDGIQGATSGLIVIVTQNYGG